MEFIKCQQNELTSCSSAVGADAYVAAIELAAPVGLRLAEYPGGP